MCMRSVSVLLLLLAIAAPSAAQQSSRIDADRLPIDMQRIRRELRSSEIREEREGLNLRYFLNIYGEAPAIRLFLRNENLKTGPVPHTAPTHQEFIEYWTPQEFRAPAMDLNALVQWIAQQAARRNR